jgi:hypothetical protein
MNEQISRTTTRPFDYRRDEDGCDDVYCITDHRGVTLASIPFWDEPDTDDAERALALARLLAAAPSLLAALEWFESAWRVWAEDIRRNPPLAEKTEMFHIYNAARDALALAKSG